jgi:signal transduction histidine kinase/integral membrane sensor domain MASE1
MLIHLPKVGLTENPRWTGGVKQLGAAIAVALTVAASQVWLGNGGEYLAWGFAQGIGLALLWIGGEQLAWGVMGGMAIAGGASELNAVGAHSAAIGTALIAGILAGGSLIVARRGLAFWGFSPLGHRLQDGIGFLVAGVGVSATLTAIAWALAAFWQPASPPFLQTLGLTGLGSASGILLVTPVLLKLKYLGRGLWRSHSPRKLLEVFLCGGSLLALARVMFTHRPLMMPLLESGGLGLAQWLEYLPFPIVVWASIRFPNWGGVLATNLLAIWAIAATVNGYGTFTIQSTNLSGAMLLLQTYFLVLGTTSLLLSVAVGERRRTEAQLRASWERERLLSEVARRVRQSLEVGQIFQTTVEEVRQLLHADRVYIALLNPVRQLELKAESCDSAYPALPLTPSYAPHHEATLKISPSRVLVVHHPDQLPTGSELKSYFRHYQVKALLAIPLATMEGALGMIVVHQCRQPRHWQKAEVRLLEQLGTQVAIAVHQAQLYQQVQELNGSLEQQVAERTGQLNDKMTELQELQQMKAVFVQAISHDLRTSVLGLLMVLKSLPAAPDQAVSLSRPILDRLIHSGDRQLTLLNALAEEQAADGHPLNLQWETIFLIAFLNQLVQNWRSPLAQHQVTLTVQYPETLPPINGDRHYLQQVFDNLLGNALKHNPPGITLTLKVHPEAQAVRFTLSDNGKGMASEQCQNLFRLYLRNRHNQRLTGIGLGCYQSRQIVEAHGGQIGVSSTPGKGSQFWFTLPIVFH